MLVFELYILKLAPFEQMAAKVFYFHFRIHVCMSTYVVY